MSNSWMEEIDKITRNRYEAVLIAAQRARQINSHRQAQLERMVEEEVNIDTRKVTSIALQDLSEGTVKFKRNNEE
ncbi:MAG TPA: DNA-directed RNA polymerase subunit omega [candidate division Zixibacteria bacterium]|nr:DNA-directed RNA polymerase subunit omega [candidate division Zixibacteria bacterium]